MDAPTLRRPKFRHASSVDIPDEHFWKEGDIPDDHILEEEALKKADESRKRKEAEAQRRRAETSQHDDSVQNSDFKKSIYVTQSEREVQADLRNRDLKLQSGGCEVEIKRSHTGTGVRLHISSRDEKLLNHYVSKLDTHFNRPKSHQRVFGVRSSRKRIDELLSKPALQSTYCQVDVCRPKSDSGWDIVVTSQDKIALDRYFEQLRTALAGGTSEEERQKSGQETLIADGPTLMNSVNAGMKIPGEGAPLVARQLARASRNSSRGPLPRRSTLSGTPSSSRDDSPASKDSGPKIAFGPNIHRQTVRLQGYYKGDLTPGRAEAWLKELSDMCKGWNKITAVGYRLNPETGNTLEFSGLGRDLDTACNDIKNYLLVQYNRPEDGQWRLLKAEGSLDVYEWCPAPRPEPSSTFRPQTSRRTSTNVSLPRPPSASRDDRGPQYAPREARGALHTAPRATPAFPSSPPQGLPRRQSFRYVASSEVQDMLPRPLRGSVAADAPRRHSRHEQPAERIVYVYPAKSSGILQPPAPSSTAGSTSTKANTSVFSASAPSRASTMSSVDFNPKGPVEVGPTKRYGSVRVERREPSSRVASTNSNTVEDSAPSRRRPSAGGRRVTETTVKVVRTRQGLALSRPRARK